MIKPIRRVVGLCILIVSTTVTVSAQDLAVIGETEDGAVSIAGVDEKGHLLVQAGEKIFPAPEKITWKIQGDVRQHAEWFVWTPSYTIERIGEPAIFREPDYVFRSRVGFISRITSPKVRQSLPFRQTLEENWREEALNNRVLVSVWLLGGVPLHVDVEAIRNGSTSASSGGILLKAGEEKGHPAVLLWKDWAFQKPIPRFADREIQDALVSAICDDEERVKPVLARHPRLAGEMSSDGRPFYALVAEAGAENVTALLLGTPPKIHARPSGKQRSALHDAAAKGRDGAVKILLKAKLDRDALPEGGVTPMTEAANYGHVDVVKSLLAAGADPDIASLDLRGPFSQSVNNGYADIVEALYPRVRMRMFDSPENQGVLRTQARSGHASMVRWMLKKGVSPNTEDMGFTALALAAEGGHASTVEALIEGKADVGWVQKKTGYTALMFAASRGRVMTVRALLKAGADPKVRDNEGGTALHAAALAEAPLTIRRLLEHGAQLDAKNHAGLSALDLALGAQNEDAVDALEKAGAKIDLSGENAAEAVEAALMMDRAELLSRALQDGWKPNSVLRGDWPAIAAARLLKSQRCEELLMKAGADGSSAGPYLLTKAIDAPPRQVDVFKPIDPRPVGEVFEEETVLVEALLNGDGRLLFTRIVKASEKRLGLAVIDAVSAWKLSPVTSGGKIVATRVKLPVVFPASNKRAVNLRDLDQMPQVISQQPPVYPEEERKRGLQARVVLELTITAEGLPTDIRVVEHTSPAFSKAAIAALEKWKYKPGLIDGKPVAARVSQEMNFSLDR
jgi:uncharacterized protein